MKVKLARILAMAIALGALTVTTNVSWAALKSTPMPRWRILLVIVIVLAAVVAGWLYGAVFVSRYLLH
jgi:uncharacterized membrane protein